MGNEFLLTYLPIPAVHVMDGNILRMRQFNEDIPACMFLDDPDYMRIFRLYIRKLKLKIQRIYRREIQLSGKTFEDFHLKIVTDFTIVDTKEIDRPYFIYCILELCENG